VSGSRERKASGSAHARYSTLLCCRRGSAVAVEHVVTIRARRVSLRMDTGTTTIPEERESGDLFFCFRADDNIVCWVVWTSVEAYQHAAERNRRPTVSVSVKIIIKWH
jgi:hypothetical protein